MKKNAYADTTIKATRKRLEHLERNSNLDNPEQVKGFIATKQCSNAYKESLVEAYNHHTKANEITWNKPFYRRYDKQPKIPTTEHLNLLIANARTKMALFLSMSKDLGLFSAETAPPTVRHGIVRAPFRFVSAYAIRSREPSEG